MYKLRTHDRNGNEIYAPNNAPIINIQCGDPLIELLSNWVNPEDNDWTVADLLDLIKEDLEYKETKRFLEEDLHKLFKAVGLED